MQETQLWSLGWEDPLEKGMATPLLPGKSHGQRRLSDYSPWGLKELDMTKQLSLLIFCVFFLCLKKWQSLSCVWLFVTSWNSPGQNTGVGSLSLLQRIFPTQGLNSGLLHCRRILYQLSHKGSPRILEWVAYPFSSGSSWNRNPTRVSCIARVCHFLTKLNMHLLYNPVISLLCFYSRKGKFIFL